MKAEGLPDWLPPTVAANLRAQGDLIALGYEMAETKYKREIVAVLIEHRRKLAVALAYLLNRCEDAHVVDVALTGDDIGLAMPCAVANEYLRRTASKSNCAANAPLIEFYMDTGKLPKEAR